MEKEQLFMIRLDDYSIPRYKCGGRPYVGTKSELEEFANKLERRKDVAMRYKDLIQGIRHYDSCPNAVHYAGGVEYQVMYPVKEIYRREFALEKHKWTYETFHESLYRFYADWVGISQILVQGESFFLRCSKATFEGLAVSYMRAGWCDLMGISFGFPEMIQMENDGTLRHSMSLSIAQSAYTLEERDAAFASMAGILDYDMTDVTRDIMAMG